MKDYERLQSMHVRTYLAGSKGVRLSLRVLSRFVTAAKARRMSKAGVPVPHHLPLTHSSHTSTIIREQHHCRLEPKL